MKKRESGKCEMCHCRKSVEHVLKEREILKDRVMDMGRKWSIKGLLEVWTIDYIYKDRLYLYFIYLYTVYGRGNKVQV